jgi:hypothetical protein
MVGIGYAQFAPGAPPFVAVGAHVSPDMTVALVEVMRMFNAVPAGVDGTVVEVLASNLGHAAFAALKRAQPVSEDPLRQHPARDGLPPPRPDGVGRRQLQLVTAARSPRPMLLIGETVLR